MIKSLIPFLIMFIIASRGFLLFKAKNCLRLSTSIRSAGNRIVVEEGRGGVKYQSKISSTNSALQNEKIFYCDNPVDDSIMQPSPRELLLGSLGSCTAMTIRTFFENSCSSSLAWKESSLEEICIHAEEEMGTDKHVPIAITLNIELKGRMTEVQVGSLERAASLCPIKRIIMGNNGNHSGFIRTSIRLTTSSLYKT
jgi:uncharacterized OsmC-like protein